MSRPTSSPIEGSGSTGGGSASRRSHRQRASPSRCSAGRTPWHRSLPARPGASLEGGTFKHPGFTRCSCRALLRGEALAELHTASGIGLAGGILQFL